MTNSSALSEKKPPLGNVWANQFYLNLFACTFSKAILPLSMSTMIFCYKNCSDLLWEKKCSIDQEKLLKFEAEGREFAIFLRSLEQLIQIVKGQNKFW